MSTRVYLAFDGRMALHAPLPTSELSLSENSSIDNDDEEGQHNHFEIPHRAIAIYERLIELEAADGYRRFLEIPCIEATREIIELVHSPEHYDFMARTESMTEEELRILTVPNDLYFCPKTFLAAKLAVGGVVECVNAVTDVNRKSNRAIAIVRPPGHHAERNEAMGTSS
jgi:histone deacetylase 6